MCSNFASLSLLIIHIIKPGMCGCRPCASGFLKLFLFVRRYVCVCVSAPEGINNQCMIWCDIGCVWLVKPILQHFSLLPSISWMGMALVTQRIVHTRQRCWSWHRNNHRKRCINYLAALVIKLSGWMHSHEFKRRLGFNYTVIILA